MNYLDAICNLSNWAVNLLSNLTIWEAIRDDIETMSDPQDIEQLLVDYGYTDMG